MVHEVRLDDFLRRCGKWQRRALKENKRHLWVGSSADAVHLLAARIPDLLSEESAPEVPHQPDLREPAAACLGEMARESMTWFPEPFREAMTGQPSATVPAWDVAFRSFFWEEIKTETSVHRVVSLRLALAPRNATLIAEVKLRRAELALAY